MKYKSDVFDTFCMFKLQVETLLSSKIRQFRLDGGGGYMSAKFCHLLSTNGVTHQISYPFTPEQNGCAERKHRLIIETGLTLLFNAFIPSMYWVNAFLTSVYLINRMPMKQLNFISLGKKLFHDKLNCSVLRVFGCAWYPWLRPYSQNKFLPRTKKCILLGYSLNYKGYRCILAMVCISL